MSRKKKNNPKTELPKELTDGSFFDSKAYFEEYDRARKTYERDQRREERNRRTQDTLRDKIVLYDALNFMALIGWIMGLIFIFYQVWEWFERI